MKEFQTQPTRINTYGDNESFSMMRMSLSWTSGSKDFMVKFLSVSEGSIGGKITLFLNWLKST